jgi:glutamate racemase
LRKVSGVSDDRAVGVFDSGVGGLSVLRAIRDELPAEPVVYAADSAHAPYGDRPRDYIEERALAMTGFLVDLGAKAVVVACNTATGAAVEALRASFSIPIVAMEPAVKPAAAGTRTGAVGVLATTSTLSSAKFLRLVDQFGAGVQVLVQPCPGLVEQVERAELDTAATRALVDRYIEPLVSQGVDTIVLGCTHYAFLRPLIQASAGAGVALVDPAQAVARELARRLNAADLRSSGRRPGGETFFTSGDVEAAGAVIRRLWAPDADVRALMS